jgi:signal transduction histidine kinase
MYRYPGMEEFRGFSLAVAKQVAVLHGGTISADNNSGKGAISCVRIPLEHP